MKNLTQYRYTIEVAMYKYLKDKNVLNLLSEINRCELHYRLKNNLELDFINKPDDKGFWFKFGSDDRLATTKDDTVHTHYGNKNNYELMIENMVEVCSLIPDFELMIFFS